MKWKNNCTEHTFPMSLAKIELRPIHKTTLRQYVDYLLTARRRKLIWGQLGQKYYTRK